MIGFSRSPKFVLLVDSNSGTQIEMDRDTAKAFARFLMVELTVVDALLIDGRNLLEFDKKFATMVKSKHSNEEIESAAQKARDRRIGN